MNYILIVFLTYVLHLLLKLNWISTAVVLVFLMITQYFHRRKNTGFKAERQRFLDVSLYIDTLLYSFLKEKKIIRAFEDVKSTLEPGTMRDVVSKAIEHMMLTFDETQVFVDAMKIIEDEYKCNRIVSVHEFMAHAEYYGGDIEESAKILLEDKSAWERRVLRNIEERQRMFKQIILSVVMSVIISGIILYLPILNMDISSNIIVQILAVVLVIMDDMIILWGQKFLETDYLSIDLLPDDEKHAKKLEEYRKYNPAKGFKTSLLMAVIPTIITGYLLYKGRSWPAVVAMGITLVMLNQHRIGHRLMKKNLIAEVKSAFPKWLMDLALLIQSENVQVAIQKSREPVPVILKDEVELLVNRLEVEPESSSPYHRFLDCLKLPEINAAMGMLYAVSIGNSGSCGSQIDELITKNLELLDVSDTARLKDKTAGMYLLFLAPVITASFKLIVDMAVFLLSFLAYKVG